MNNFNRRPSNTLGLIALIVGVLLLASALRSLPTRGEMQARVDARMEMIR